MKWRKSIFSNITGNMNLEGVIGDKGHYLLFVVWLKIRHLTLTFFKNLHFTFIFLKINMGSQIKIQVQFFKTVRFKKIDTRHFRSPPTEWFCLTANACVTVRYRNNHHQFQQTNTWKQSQLWKRPHLYNLFL